MSNAAANKAILVKAYGRWHETLGGSVEEFMDVLADDIRLGSLAHGASPLAFTSQAVGKAAVRGYFEGLLAAWTMVFYRIDHFVAEEDRVVAIGEAAWTNNKTGKTCTSPKVDVWRFSGGKAVEFFEYYDTAKLFEASN